MSTPLATALVRAGLLDVNMIAELIRWKLPVDLPKVSLERDPVAAALAIQQAIEDHDQVEVRETDLELLKLFLKTQTIGRLHVAMMDETAEFEVAFGRTRCTESNGKRVLSGDYIIPYRSESICEVMTNELTHLIDGRKKVFFSEAKDFFFGGTKAFMVCTPTK
jgi:hypothetical protein